MTPEAIAGITDSDFVSTLELALPQCTTNEMFLRYGTQGIAYLLIRSLGFEKEIKGDSYFHFEKDHAHENFTVYGSVGAPGAGNDMVLVLDTTSLDVNNKYYPRLFDEVLFHNEVPGWIQDITVTPDGISPGVSSVQLTIRPNDETDDIGAVTAGDDLIIYSATFPEGSGMPVDAISGTTKFTNESQLLKEAVGATGTSLVTETYIKQYNAAGEFQGYYKASQFDLDYRMLTKLDGMFWFSKRISTTANRALDSVSGYDHKATEGLIPAIRRLGHTNTYTPGAFSVTKFDEYDRILTQEYVLESVPMWMPMGINLYQEMENTLVTYFADTNIDYTKKVVNDMLFKKNDALGASINFKYLQKSSRTWMFNKLVGWSNKKTYGSTGYDMQKMGVAIPLELRKDPQTKNDIPSIGTRYRAMGAYNRRFITSTLAGVGAAYNTAPIDDIDKTRSFQFCHMGCEFFGLNRFILIDNT